MCNFFSFVTEPEANGGKRYYFDWKYRKAHLKDDGPDSHDHIIQYYGLGKKQCNTFEYDPLTKNFVVDAVHSSIDDTAQAHEWVEKLDWKEIIKPLIIKPIINPFELPKVEEVTPEIIELLKKWSAVWSAVGSEIYAYISSFFNIKFKYDFSSGIKLWEMGIVSSFDGKTWRLHSGKKAEVIYSISAAELAG